MNNCLKCDNQIDDHRYHLGYTECVECSDTEKYSAHQVYPHKTGGYVQPVSSNKKKHLDSIDRRSRGSGSGGCGRSSSCRPVLDQLTSITAPNSQQLFNN